MAGKNRGRGSSKGEKQYYFIRILIWLLAIVVVSFGILIFVQQLRIVDLRNFFPTGVDGSLPPPNWQEMELLDQDRLTSLMVAIDQRAEELDVAEKKLSEEQMQVEEHHKLVEKEQNAVAEEKKRLSETQKLYDKKKETITQTARELTQMNETVAVQILERRDNQDIIWIMQVTDELAAEGGSFSLVPIWLELMDPARTAEIQRERDLIPDLEIK